VIRVGDQNAAGLRLRRLGLAAAARQADEGGKRRERDQIEYAQFSGRRCHRLCYRNFVALRIVTQLEPGKKLSRKVYIGEWESI
jgi:hypothetical protein